MGGLVGVLLVSLFILSRTEWGKTQIGETVTGWFSGHGAVAAASAPDSTMTPAAGPAGQSAPAPAAAAPKSQRQIPPLPTRRPQPTAGTPARGGGEFAVLLALDRNAAQRSPARRLVYQSRVLYAHTDYLNSLFVLPKNINVIVKRCGFSNMYWDTQKEDITICDEMIEDLGRVFADEPDDAVFRRRVMFATSFFMFHEVGHALVQEYGLKGFGKSEDVADQIAVLLLLGNDQAEAIATGADAFMGFAAQRPKDAPVAFWDEHSLNEQRFYNLVCWVYGSNPDRFANLVGDHMLPAERAGRCPGEYADAIDAFNDKLGPHLKR
jgi:hypothetical protein